MSDAPSVSEAYLEAVRHFEAGRLESCEQACLAILRAGRHAQTLDLLALLNIKARRFGAAEQLLGLALGVERNASYLTHLGIALSEQGRVADGVAAFEDALRLKPDDIDTLVNLGVALQKEGRHAEAAAAQRGILARRPGSATAVANLATAVKDLGRVEEAVVLFHQALALSPRDPYAHFALSLALLLEGHLIAGWAEYEWRWMADELMPLARAFPQPQWGGEPALGRTILLHAEQGLGDTIQFVRYAPMVAARGFRVILEAPRVLVRLLAAAMPGLAIVPKGDPLPAFDLHCPLLSLPRAFATDLESIPAPRAYLAADPARIAHWRQRLPREGFRVGVVWQGAPGSGVDRGRSVPLAVLAPLAAMPGVRLISLQKRHGLDQLQTLPGGMVVETPGADFDEGPDAFLDTAAVVASLDLVITSDTAVAHVVGALGRPGWVLLKHVPDWRWLLDRDDTPWYPSLRLFRQNEPGDWAGVVERVVAALADRMAMPEAAGPSGPRT